jgi:D-aspartate ligase
LIDFFRVPTPSWYPHALDELEQIDADPPFAVKPAIKEHFIYTTKAKAWRANNRSELRELFERAVAHVGRAK